MRQILVTGLAIVAFGATLVLAQRPYPGRGPGGPGGPDGFHPHVTGGGAEQSWAERRVQFFASRASLTDAQKQQALSIFTASDQSSEPLDERLSAARKALRDASRRAATAGEIDQLAATVGTLTGQLAAIQAKADASFFALLTSDQREKMDQRPASRPRRDQ